MTPDEIATAVADRCSEFRKDGEPKAPARYAMIWQAARLGARDALKPLAGIENPAAYKAAMEALLTSAGMYFDRYLQDEAEELGCCIDDRQHKAAQEFRTALQSARAARGEV